MRISRGGVFLDDTYPPDCNDNFIKEVRDLGCSLKENYGEFVSPALLEKWQSDPVNAPGRVSSSPWPERIDIVSIEKLSDSEYVVNGNIINMTSVEMTQGGIAGNKSVTLNIKKIEDQWLIDDYTYSSMSKLITVYMVIEDNLLFPDEVEIITREDKERIEELSLIEDVNMPSGYTDSPPAQKVPFFIEAKDGKVINITEKSYDNR